MVYLIGTGPGDEELLTLKAVKALKKCTAVLYDRLGAGNILNYLNEDCEIYYCGKEPGVHYKTQEEINETLVRLAKEGHTVGRIKGGDPFVFGRGGEEILSLLDAGIDEFEVIPGVTSPISVLSYAGIPVTHRGLAQDFHIVTGMSKGTLNVNYKALAKEDGTLIFMMGLGNLGNIVENLIKYGKPKDTKAAVVMKGTTSKQKSVTGTLENIEERVKEAGFVSPCIIVVGEVVQFSDKFNWYEKKPLYGHNICITRSKDQSYSLKEKLTSLGAQVTPIYSLKIVDKNSSLKLVNLEDYKHIVLTSVNAVKGLFAFIKENKIDLRSIKADFYCVGSATTKALEEHYIVPKLTCKEFLASELISELKDIINVNERVLWPTSNLAKNTMKEELQSIGAIVDKVDIYDTVCGDLLDEKVFDDVDEVFYTSPSTVKNMIKMLGIEKIRSKKAISIGPVTSKELAKNNIDYLECKKHSEDGFIDEIIDLLK